MRPDGKALDIVVVGLGQAGGNLAAEFFRRGYRALALNTAETDLSALEAGGVFPTMPPERRLYVGLDGYDGAGADPTYGRQCIREHADRIRQTVLKQASDADAVILTAGLGGGTGSAVAELVDVLKDEDLPLIALMTLPTESESGIAKVNAVRAINEMVDAPLMGWIFVDNARISSLNPDISVVDYYAHINSEIVGPIDAFNRLNARDNLHAIRSFDGEDFRKLLLSGGVLNYAFSELPGITVEEVVGTMRDCIEASDVMPGGFDMKRLSYVGLVIEAPESALANVPISTFEEIDAQIKKATEGAAIYQGIYRTAPDQPTMLRLIAATQSLPHRIRQILADAKREGQVLGEKIREELPTLELGEISGFELFRTKTRPSERPRRSKLSRRPADLVEDIAMEIGGRLRAEPAEVESEVEASPREVRGPRRMRGRRPAPPAAQSTPAEDTRRPRPAPSPSQISRPPASTPPRPLREPPPELGTEEIDVVAQLAELRSLPIEDEDDDLQETNPATLGKRGDKNGTTPTEMPSPDIYDQLVARYVSAKTVDERKELAGRLEADSLSDDTIVRYYAVEAMSKLGRKVFGNALLQATEDEDEAVRNLAVEALKA